MFRNLNCGAIGVPADLQQSFEYARLGGFQGLDVRTSEVFPLLKQHGAAYVKDLFAENHVHMGGVGFPVRWMESEAIWSEDLTKLPDFCQKCYEIGAVRAATWVPSWNDELDWDDNCAFHVQRFKPVAAIMAEYDMRLGLEFLGPKTLRDGHKYEFIHTMEQMLELCACLGPNVGLLLDAWHWYTAGGELKDLKHLTNDQVVYVHINDAPPDIPLDQQVDSVRAVPGETGVIDLSGFLQALKAIGYDGPVTPEPFSAKLDAMEDKAAAVKWCGEMLKDVWESAGI